MSSLTSLQCECVHRAQLDTYAAVDTVIVELENVIVQEYGVLGTGSHTPSAVEAFADVYLHGYHFI
jgi:hypothetical protein